MKILNYTVVWTFISCALLIFTLNSCKKIVEVDLPIDKKTAQDVFDKPSTAILAMTGIYSAMGNEFDGSLVGRLGIAITSGQLADELIPPYAYANQSAYFNNLNGDSPYSPFWVNSYKYLVFRVNSVIKGVEDSKGIPENIKKILIGEAKFTRAFIYFNLVNYYGDVPLVTTTDFKTNSVIPRSSIDIVYQQIIADLLDSQVLLNDNYLETLGLSITTAKRVRPNKAAATALLARVYLYRKNWGLAAAEASKIISNTAMYKLAEIDKVFLKNSEETIWALQPGVVDRGSNCPDASWFITDINEKPYSISDNLYNAFEPGDLRKTNWISSINRLGSDLHIPYKYKVGQGDASQPQSEYNIVLRLGEVYLIRAEARAHLGDLDASKSDLLAVRSRSGLGGVNAVSMEGILMAVAHERQIELFSEWGHRWFDLKRTGQIDVVMTEVVKTKIGLDGTRATWLPFKALLPIPYDEFKYNPSLVGHQNPGYTEN